MDVVADYEARDNFYMAEEGGDTYRGGEMVNGEWSYSMLPFQEEERKG
jgi:hypothetical protein